MVRQPFECKEEYTRALDAIWKFTEDKPMGFVLTYEQIEELTGFSYGSRQFNHLVQNRLLKRLRNDRDIVAKNVRGIGYRFVPRREVPKLVITEQTKKAKNDYLRGENKLRTLKNHLNELTPQLRKSTLAGLEMFRNKRIEANRTLRAAERKTETIPVRKIPK